ncbi:hypothetical protein PG993_012507 [Apiospora rasikravindrae]|uniref:Uncharacterized protein n=1 Tax=Apiospora rasikravindrae TaxID=990691 RepID=A0ABR1S4F5_9PEZI
MVVDFHIVLTETKALCILAIDTRGYAKELGNPNINGFTARCTDAGNLVVELDDLGYLFNSHLRSAARSGDEAVSILDNPVLGEQAYSRRFVRLHIYLFQLLQIASEKELDRRCSGLPRRGAVKNSPHIRPNLPRVRTLRDLGWLRDCNGSLGLGVFPTVVDELDVQDAAGEMVLGVQTVDDGVRDDIARLCGNVLVVEVDADVPVDAEERISPYLDADRPPSRGDGPQHGEHVGAPEADG